MGPGRRARKKAERNETRREKGTLLNKKRKAFILAVTIGAACFGST
jgi:hypothetical protein